jgi:hypothetical protein
MTVTINPFCLRESAVQGLKHLEDKGIIMHQYAIGNLSAIKMGELSPSFEDMTRTFNLEKAKEYFKSQSKSSSLIISPKLIGVYRRFIPGGCIEDLDSYENASLLTLGLKTDKDFEVHPSLVQIGFDPSMIEKGVIREFIGSESERMLIVPYTNLKPSGESLRKFSGLTSKLFTQFLEGEEIDKAGREEYLSIVKELSQTEGLTMMDYMFLKADSLFSL